MSFQDVFYDINQLNGVLHEKQLRELDRTLQQHRLRIQQEEQEQKALLCNPDCYWAEDDEPDKLRLALMFTLRENHSITCSADGEAARSAAEQASSASASSRATSLGVRMARRALRQTRSHWLLDEDALGPFPSLGRSPVLPAINGLGATLPQRPAHRTLRSPIGSTVSTSSSMQPACSPRSAGAAADGSSSASPSDTSAHRLGGKLSSMQALPESEYTRPLQEKQERQQEQQAEDKQQAIARRPLQEHRVAAANNNHNHSDSGNGSAGNSSPVVFRSPCASFEGTGSNGSASTIASATANHIVVDIPYMPLESAGSSDGELMPWSDSDASPVASHHTYANRPNADRHIAVRASVGRTHTGSLNGHEEHEVKGTVGSIGQHEVHAVALPASGREQQEQESAWGQQYEQQQDQQDQDQKRHRNVLQLLKKQLQQQQQQQQDRQQVQPLQQQQPRKLLPGADSLPPVLQVRDMSELEMVMEALEAANAKNAAKNATNDNIANSTNSANSAEPSQPSLPSYSALGGCGSDSPIHDAHADAHTIFINNHTLTIKGNKGNLSPSTDSNDDGIDPGSIKVGKGHHRSTKDGSSCSGMNGANGTGDAIYDSVGDDRARSGTDYRGDRDGNDGANDDDDELWSLPSKPISSEQERREQAQALRRAESRFRAVCRDDEAMAARMNRLVALLAEKTHVSFCAAISEEHLRDALEDASEMLITHMTDILMENSRQAHQQEQRQQEQGQAQAQAVQQQEQAVQQQQQQQQQGVITSGRATGAAVSSGLVTTSAATTSKSTETAVTNANDVITTTSAASTSKSTDASITNADQASAPDKSKDGPMAVFKGLFKGKADVDNMVIGAAADLLQSDLIDGYLGKWRQGTSFTATAARSGVLGSARRRDVGATGPRKTRRMLRHVGQWVGRRLMAPRHMLAQILVTTDVIQAQEAREALLTAASSTPSSLSAPTSLSLPSSLWASSLSAPLASSTRSSASSLLLAGPLLTPGMQQALVSDHEKAVSGQVSPLEFMRRFDLWIVTLFCAACRRCDFQAVYLPRVAPHHASDAHLALLMGALAAIGQIFRPGREWSDNEIQTTHMLFAPRPLSEIEKQRKETAPAGYADGCFGFQLVDWQPDACLTFTLRANMPATRLSSTQRKAVTRVTVGVKDGKSLRAANLSKVVKSLQSIGVASIDTTNAAGVRAVLDMIWQIQQQSKPEPLLPAGKQLVVCMSINNLSSNKEAEVAWNSMCNSLSLGLLEDDDSKDGWLERADTRLAPTLLFVLFVRSPQEIDPELCSAVGADNRGGKGKKAAAAAAAGGGSTGAGAAGGKRKK